MGSVGGWWYSSFRLLSTSSVRYFISIKWNCCRHVCIGIKGMYHCLKRLVTLFVCMPWMPNARIMNVTYHLASFSASTKGWHT